MRLGIVVTDKHNAGAAVKVLHAALGRDWQCRCFLTDSGISLLANEEFMRLVDGGTAPTAVCELSVERYAQPGVTLAQIQDRVVVGGQYQDAELVRWCDRVMVF